ACRLVNVLITVIAQARGALSACSLRLSSNQLNPLPCHEDSKTRSSTKRDVSLRGLATASIRWVSQYPHNKRTGRWFLLLLAELDVLRHLPAVYLEDEPQRCHLL